MSDEKYFPGEEAEIEKIRRSAEKMRDRAERAATEEASEISKALEPIRDLDLEPSYFERRREAELGELSRELQELEEFETEYRRRREIDLELEDLLEAEETEKRARLELLKYSASHCFAISECNSAEELAEMKLEELEFEIFEIEPIRFDRAQDAINSQF